MFALDTNTLIYFFKESGQVADRLLNTAPSDIAIPVTVKQKDANGYPCAAIFRANTLSRHARIASMTS